MTTKTTEPVGPVQLMVHAGKNLMIIAGKYPTLNRVILELVQNSLDSAANEIIIRIDYQKRYLAVRDNGQGIDQTDFQKAIQSICESVKTTDKFGRFGIGLISPIDKCQKFIITSAKRPKNDNYLRWSFDSEEILNNADFPKIPCEPMINYVFSRTGKAGTKRPVDWRTEVALYGFSKDKTISTVSVNDLRSDIINQFSEGLKKLDATVIIDIKNIDGTENKVRFQAQPFQGKKLDKISFGDSTEGETIFELYLAPKTKTGRKGEIAFGITDDPFRIPSKIFVKFLQKINYASPETIKLLTSGVFEGHITTSKCSLLPNRQEFAENDYCLQFNIHLDLWAKNHGQKYVIELKDENRDAWLQALGSVAINGLEEKIKAMPHLANLVKGFKMGTIGPGHKDFPKISKTQKFKSTKVKPSQNKTPEDKPVSDTPGGDKDQSTYPGHMPATVGGPRGTRRKPIRGDSTGIQFVYEEMMGSDHHWEFDPEYGMVIFNIRSNIWSTMEQAGERNLILYQQYIAIKALELQLEAPSTRETIYLFLQRELETASMLIVASNSLQPRKAKDEVGKRLKK